MRRFLLRRLLLLALSVLGAVTVAFLLMRMIPGLVVIDPMDATEIAAATEAIADHPGPVYMRLLRGAVPVVLEPGTRFEIGKARKLRDGHDIGIISTIKRVITVFAVDCVRPYTTIYYVVSRATFESIIAVLAVYLVIPDAAVQSVVSRSAIDDVVIWRSAGGDTDPYWN